MVGTLSLYITKALAMTLHCRTLKATEWCILSSFNLGDEQLMCCPSSTLMAAALLIVVVAFGDAALWHHWSLRQRLHHWLCTKPEQGIHACPNSFPWRQYCIHSVMCHWLMPCHCYMPRIPGLAPRTFLVPSICHVGGWMLSSCSLDYGRYMQSPYQDANYGLSDLSNIHTKYMEWVRSVCTCAGHDSPQTTQGVSIWRLPSKNCH